MIEKKLIVCYLPTYSPELNLIEILWGKVKYEWLNLMKVMDFDEFQKELKRVFDMFVQEYMISFVRVLTSLSLITELEINYAFNPN